ncbi:hypothetical protein GGH95_002534 [Coemansia sp. RSA 1836]|nr:hypothetical protein GGH95_002534 [Coemansia sp. RSA 1836]
MVVALDGGGGGGGDGGRRDEGWADNCARRGSSGGCCALGPISRQQLMASRVVHLSDTLRRKMHSIAPASAAASRTVGDMLRFAASSDAEELWGGGLGGSNSRMRAVSSGLWSMLGWLVGSSVQSPAGEKSGGSSSLAAPDARSGGSAGLRPPHRRREVAEAPCDDPLLVGNEGLGAVELAEVRAADGGGGGDARQACIFALCAHALAPATRDEWRAWRQGRRGAAGEALGLEALAEGDEGCTLAVVHVAEVSTLHRVACAGMASVVPPALALAQLFAPLLAGNERLGPAPQLPALVRGDATAVGVGVGAAVRSMALLVSRHGLVEMAYPLSATRLLGDEEGEGEGEGEGGLSVALGALLGESLFSRIHPEDVARVVKALRLAWDARPDAFHFARLRREWQRRRQAPQAPASPVGALDSRQTHHADGIEVANGVAALTLQLQVTGAAVDWRCADSMARHARFARVQLARWPLVLARRGGGALDCEPPHDGFVLADIQPLAEPARARTPPLPPAASSAKQRSISSVASASTLVGLGSAALLDSAELVRLCRSASSLSFEDGTAPVPNEFPSAVPIPRMPNEFPGAVPIPAASLAKRRSSIAPASLHASASNRGGGGAFGTPRELAY